MVLSQCHPLPGQGEDGLKVLEFEISVCEYFYLVAPIQNITKYIDRRLGLKFRVLLFSLVQKKALSHFGPCRGEETFNSLNIGILCLRPILIFFEIWSVCVRLFLGKDGFAPK